MVGSTRWSLRRESEAAVAVSRRFARRTGEIVRQGFPPLRWGKTYSPHVAASDFVAGITVGLTLIPQAIAYAGLAGLGPQYGLYSSFAGSLVYILLGTTPEINIGPSALLSLLTFNYTHDSNPDMAVLLCFLAGIIELICGFLQLGFLVQFVSLPVVSGFTSAAAIIIASSQVKGLLGVKYKAEGFKEIWVQLYHHIGESRLWDIVLSCFCVATLLLLKRLKEVKTDENTPRGRFLGKFYWYLSNARNALVVVVCACLAKVFQANGSAPFVLTGEIDVGIPPVGPPPFSTHFGNTTYGFIEMCQYLGSGILVTPIIGIIGNVAIAKAFANGKVVEATQEMVALGFCNIFGSFFRSMPVNGSFSRSAVSNASGVRTPLAGLYTGVMVLLALSFLTPYFYYIPKATLASVIICAVIFMVEVDKIKPMWRTNKRDLLSALVTFVACLLIGVEYGILVGIAVDMSFLLYSNARPKVLVEIIPDSHGTPDHILIVPSAGLLFPAIDFIRDVVSRTEIKGKKMMSKADLMSIPVVVDCKHISLADYTVKEGIEALIVDFRKNGRNLIFHNLNPSVMKILDNISHPDFVTCTTDSDLHHILRGVAVGKRISVDTKLEMETVKRHSVVSIKDSGV
ncbi:sodium-independent sulfate anion transporter-like [Ischnura elegans]|uniref:sodium-independent sulfate anion transporter-like n=1 Tax=Ischnura elegans TaxID=197161 RepID=UPI001ED88946|nr:sodium-independent sulfate anion transporter-like [Ischnura elegans]